MLTILNRLAPAMPQPVFRAVELMYTGAALTVLCIGTALDLREGAIEVRALDVIIWLVALAATIQLWRPESGPFYQKPLALVQ
jgi:hypothetical protein